MIYEKSLKKILQSFQCLTFLVLAFQEEGIGYRGRIFLSIQMEEGESASDDGISNVLVKGATPLQDVGFQKF